MNGKLRIGAIVVVAAIAAIGKIFFVDSDEVVRFSDRMVDIMAASDKRFVAISGNLDRYVEGKPVDVAAMGRQRENLDRQVRNDVKMLQQLSVPDCDRCRTFHAACVEYVQNSHKLAVQYTEVVSYISEHNPAQEGDADNVVIMLTDLLQKDEMLRNKVVSTQKSMAGKYNIRLQ